MTGGLDLLAAVLADEHAAVYAYGVLGARLDDATRRIALAGFDAHRLRRDDIAGRLRAGGRQPAGPAAAYDVSVAGRPAALALAVRVEDALAVRWRDLVAGTDDRALRGLALAGLQDCAVRAVVWRRAAGAPMATVALPGLA